MKQFRIYFKDNDLTSVSWCYLIDGVKQQDGTELNDVFKQCAQSSTDTILIVPQFWVYETSIDINDKNAKQLLSAAAYQLEEQMAEDVDDLHFAQGKAIDNQVPFVAIKHAKMHSLIEFEKTHALKVTMIVTEMSLCPQANPDEVNVIQHEQHYLFKSSNIAQNAVCSQPQIDFFIQHFKSQHPKTIVNELDQSYSICEKNDFSGCINLKQKLYSQGHAWQALAKQFRLPIILLLLVGVFWVFNQWQENQHLAIKITQIKQQQVVLLKTNLKGYSSSGNAKTALIKALQKQQGGEQQKGFIFEFHQFLKTKKDVKSLKLNKVEYRNNQLIIDVAADNLQQLDQLIELMKKEFTVTVAQMDSSNNESQGRFVLEKR